ncbi:inositol-3-phosphate synthase [Paramuribaculum intestinale]|jgi:myo-inositol-1-phosphate synthase|uniref:Inositol-3-phosphate synthase n=53 Tax=Paramuribaculum intestinale TaxID=2094151 RepID=A0A2V1J0P9_9BACT|nr:inositol-3-phosphate synthase [Paramuribaculum intestinale]MBJ2185642.1 inositol-3-phosphate synthase [Muribaculaceae bacterium]ROS93002.1 inositol-3-phosphate synthase [Muribaculaceae bacterium Isolate-043 (Harlan)]ROT17219.1 inositol-3-phosphate synthase [Muribaculaceae bacterium Isolate-105 (HZI)]RXE62814.1 inositol-3-phosphate synthase [Muribaculaceae bacterium Isolate-004 (NCI)]MCX4329103.1 inositol-3-phosphate synthase [Paramuribaculum intestinale]
MSKSTVKPAEGKLGVLVVGLGAVSSTFMTGVLMARKGLAKPVGSMTQYDKIRVGKGADKKYLKYNEIVPIADLNDIVFGAWDVYPANAYESAINCEVLKEKDINPVKDELIKIVPMKAAFDKNYAKRLDGDNVKDVKDRWDMTEQIREDIRRFKKENGVDRVVVLWAASTEVYVPVDEKVHNTLADLEAAMKADDKEHIAPSMCYAYAALKEGAPFIMGAPNTTVDIPAMWELSEQTGMPIAGKDFKTGQTLVKSGFAPIIGTRCLGLSGWFSTNILGNRDGLVLDEPANFRTKEVSKLSTLESILVPEEQPDLYTDYYHKVRINYYPPRNDNKEGWDNIDIFGWMGYPMQIKINFLCRDSILAAPLCLDLVLLSDLAARAGRHGIQRFLSFFLKSPMHDYTKGEVPVNHLFQQYVMLKNAIREMGGYEADEEID